MALERDPDVMRYLNGGFVVENEEGDPNSSFLMPRGTEPYVWTARRTKDHAFVGWFCLWPDSADIGELGYRLSRTMWGQGFASEAGAALVNWGFVDCGYDRIYAGTLTINLPSRRVMEKIGMRLVRTIAVPPQDFFPGCEEGEVQYEVLRKDWRQDGR